MTADATKWLVAFDVGGTLLPLARSPLRSCIAECRDEEAQVAATAELARWRTRPASTGDLGRLASILSVPRDELAAAIVSTHGQRIDDLAAEVLAQVARIDGVATVVTASNCIELEDEAIALRQGLVPAHYPSWRLGVAKPDTSFFRRISALAGVRTDSCVYVGDDKKTDYYPALEAGWSAVVPGDQEAGYLCGTSVSSLGEVVTALQSM